MVLVADMVSIFGAKVLFEILMFMNINVDVHEHQGFLDVHEHHV